MTQEAQSIMEEAQQYFLHTYNRYPVVFDKGEGVYLYDIEEKKYLDFASGIGVFALGYANKEYNAALKEQVDKLLHTSNFYYNAPGASAAKKLAQASGLDKVFFTNSGAEAIEGAIKTARKYAYLKDKQTNHEIVALHHSFHGRTMGALSVTGNVAYREAFLPLIGNIVFANLNDFDSVLEAVGERTCAILIEPVQGEGGIHPAEKEFLQKVRTLCDEKDILLIFDEIQCGMGRTGSLFAWQSYGVRPDIMTVAKALGGGIPVGAFVMNEKVATNSLRPGDHGTTYGGNPLATQAVTKVFEIFEKEDILNHVKEISPYLEEQLEALLQRHENIIARRGMGLMQGLEFAEPVADIIKKALEKGLVLIGAGAKVIRFMPPLVIKKEQVDEMLAILEGCL